VLWVSPITKRGGLLPLIAFRRSFVGGLHTLNLWDLRVDGCILMHLFVAEPWYFGVVAF